MKKIRKIILFFLPLVFSLTSCSLNGKEYAPENYFLSLDYKKDFKILQLTDIHIANKDDRARQYEFLDGTISLANADMIILDGDTFTFADKTTAKEMFSFIDSYNLPWTITFGNHDEQCYFSIEWLTSYLNKLSQSSSSNCIFKDIQDDNVQGNANFVINLMENNKIKEQIIVMDSNRYNYGSYVGYDYIKQNQIDWYEKVVSYSTKQNNNVPIESILFMHIPVPEFEEGYNKSKGNDSEAEIILGGYGEGVSCPKINSGFFDKILELNSTKAIVVGHDHVNNALVLYKGVYLSYGINSTDTIYFDENMLGGQVVTIKDDNSLEFNQIIRTYEEYN